MDETLPKFKKSYFKHINRIEDYKLIKQLHEEEKYDIDFMCEQLEISRSSYYKWLKSKPTKQQLEDEKVLTEIKKIASKNNSLFGSVKMTYSLKRKGFTCGHNKVARLMCINDIKSSFRRKSRPGTYIKSTPEVTAENILKRDFKADKPFEKWNTDITEIRVPITGEKLFIAPMIDLYCLYPVGINISDRNDSILTDTLLTETHEKYPDAHPLAHSDRGFQYTRQVYKSLLESYGMTQSMSRVSRCIDNGPCENFQGIFKEILFILYPNITNKQEMIEAIYKTLDYYINEYPQTRFKGKTAGEVWNEAMNNDNPIVYPIHKSNRYIKYWNHIEELKQQHQTL